MGKILTIAWNFITITKTHTSLENKGIQVKYAAVSHRSILHLFPRRSTRPLGTRSRGARRVAWASISSVSGRAGGCRDAPLPGSDGGVLRYGAGLDEHRLEGVALREAHERAAQDQQNDVEGCEHQTVKVHWPEIRTTAHHRDIIR